MKVRLLLASVVLILLCSVVLSETYQIRVTYNTNLRASYSLDSAVLASAPAGTTLQVVGQHSRWLQINRGGRHYWMANWVAYTRVGNQRTTRDADIDNCCYVNRQCATDHDWVVGWHAFQLNECPVSQPVAPASAPVSAPGAGQPIDNCCLAGWQCTTDQQWTDGYWAYQNNQCGSPRTSTPTRPPIEASDRIVGKITEALDLLQARSQKWYEYVISAVDRIIEDPEGRTMAAGLASRTVFVGGKLDLAIPYYPQRLKVLRNISSLVHEACHIHRYAAGFEYGPYTKVSEEVACIAVEHAMGRDIRIEYPSSHVHSVVGYAHCEGSLENHPECD